MSDNIEAQVKEMAKLTVLLGKINPIQEENMKKYPLVFFNGVSSVRVEFDLATRQSEVPTDTVRDSTVSYFIEIDEYADNTLLDKRFDHLEKSVRNIFWNDVVVEVHFNGHKVYRSSP